MGYCIKLGEFEYLQAKLLVKNPFENADTYSIDKYLIILNSILNVMEQDE